MTKRNKIIYWIATIWLSLGMLSTAVVPIYFLTIIGVWKILGVAAVLFPRFPLLKEWAYAGFFFAMSGAVISHLIVGDEIKEIFGPTLLLVLTVISWHFRSADRKLILVTQ
jgi:hypothetical protein